MDSFICRINSYGWKNGTTGKGDWIATKAEDLNSILGIHMAEETDFYKMSFDSHVCNM